MVNEGLMAPLMVSFRRLAALVLLLGCSVAPTRTTGPPREPDDRWQRHSNISALNTALAFELYQDLATRTAGQQQQHNILLSPLGLVSVLVLLSQVSGPEGQSQVLEALGLEANTTEENVEATVSTLADLLRNLTEQEGGAGWEVQRPEMEGAGRGAGTGATEGGSAGAAEGRNAAGGEDAGRNQERRHRLRVWSGLRANGSGAADGDSAVHGKVPPTSVFNVSLETLLKDLQASDKPELNNSVSLRGTFYWCV